MTANRAPVLLALAAVLLLPARPAVAEPPTAAELLAHSIAYHDPGDRWGRSRLRLTIEETRPDGPLRTTVVELDPGGNRFVWLSRRGTDVLEGTLTDGECTLALNGSRTISAADRDKHRLSCERLELYRDYYGYLWGLPMKLRDPGTVLDPTVRETTLDDRAALALRVTYEPAVGDDTWDFFLDPASSALVGYRFFHDSSANDGEYIVLSGEVAAHGFRLPQTRSWFTNGEDRHLGTDTLTVLERLDPGN